MTPKPILPKIWSNPQSTFQFLKAANENVLNIIPSVMFEQEYLHLPSAINSTHVICDPKLLSIILRERANEFPKAHTLKMVLNPVIDQSIFLTDGKIWQTQHKQMIDVFNWRNIQAFEAPIASLTQDYLAKNAGKICNSSDITREMQDLTFDIISQILLGQTGNPLFSELRVVFEEYLDRAVRVSPIDFFTLNVPLFPNMRHIRSRKLIARFKALGNAIINERLGSKPPAKADFLEHLFTAFEYRNAPNSQKRDEIRDNLVTFIIAGHETTAMTLSWALYAAGFFPNSQNEISEEATLPLKDRVFTESFINETLRLYPPAPLIVRSARENCEIGDIKLNKNDSIIMPILALHRFKSAWDQPDEFLPHRFMDGFKPAHYRFMPFGAGPRICIGMSLAMMEAKIILPEILKATQITTPSHEPSPMQILTLRSKNGIKLNATLRKG